MVAIQPSVSEFNIVGKLEDFVASSKNRIKYLYLSTSESDYSIEVAKEQKNVLSQHLKTGCWLRVTGMRKYELHKDQVKYKAYRIEVLPAPATEQAAKHQSANPKTTAARPKAKVLVCRASSCWRNGGRTACELLQTELNIRGMADQVEIKTTGCLKQCKQAPNLIMPGRNRYSRVQPQQVSKLIAKHLL